MSFLLRGFFKEMEKLRRQPTAAPAEALKPEESSERRGDLRQADDRPILLEWIGDDNELRLEMAHSFDQSANGLGVECSQALPFGLPVLLTRRGERALKAVVRHCQAHQNAWRLGLRLVREDRRRQDRQPSQDKLELSWEDGARSHEGEVEIMNVAEQGLQVRLEQPLVVDSTVSVHDDSWQRFGTVVYCRPEAGGYVAGLHFSGPPRPRRMFQYQD